LQASGFTRSQNPPQEGPGRARQQQQALAQEGTRLSSDGSGRLGAKVDRVRRITRRGRGGAWITKGKEPRFRKNSVREKSRGSIVERGQKQDPTKLIRGGGGGGGGGVWGGGGVGGGGGGVGCSFVDESVVVRLMCACSLRLTFRRVIKGRDFL